MHRQLDGINNAERIVFNYYGSSFVFLACWDAMHQNFQDGIYWILQLH
jgi:hypothetical protein